MKTCLTYALWEFCKKLHQFFVSEVCTITIQNFEKLKEDEDYIVCKVTDWKTWIYSNIRNWQYQIETKKYNVSKVEFFCKDI